MRCLARAWSFSSKRVNTYAACGKRQVAPTIRMIDQEDLTDAYLDEHVLFV